MVTFAHSVSSNIWFCWRPRIEIFGGVKEGKEGNSGGVLHSGRGTTNIKYQL